MTTAPITEKSQSAQRAQTWRDKQKQTSTFNQAEAKRKRDERRQARERRILSGWLKEYEPLTVGEKTVPLQQVKLRPKKDDKGLFLSDAPRGKGKLSSGGYNSEKSEFIVGARTADAEVHELPHRAQLTDEELQQKFNSITDLQGKIDLILETWKHDEEFCAWLKELSLDDVTEFVNACGTNFEYARELLYEHTEHQKLPTVLTNVLTHVSPDAFGRRVVPKGISDDHEGPLEKETQNTFARRISWRTPEVTVIKIGSRNVRFYNLSQPIEKILEELETTSDELDHFETHQDRRNLIDAIRWYEAKAWRPQKRTCSKDHAELTRKHGQGSEKLYCSRCRKLLYKPKRSDAEVAGPE
jgi:hypothetical protein